MNASTNLMLSSDKCSLKQSHSTTHSLQERLQPSLMLEFNQSYKPNLYQKTSKYFLLDFSDMNFIAKALIPLQDGPEFSVEYVDSIWESWGILYSGFLRIFFRGCELHVKIPSEKSYDPVTDSAVSNSQFAFILAFSSIEVEAALSGVSEEGLEEIYASLQDVIKCAIGKETLIEWMHVQIKVACFKKSQPPSYEEFVMGKIILGKLQLSIDRSKEYFEAWLHNTQSVNFQNLSKDPVKLAKSGVLKRLSEVTPAIRARAKRGIKLLEANSIAKRLDYKLEKDGECVIF